MKKRPVRGALTENLIAFIPITTNKFCKPFTPPHFLRLQDITDHSVPLLLPQP